MEIKRTRVLIDNLDIDFNNVLKQITIHRHNLMPSMEFGVIPEDATLFWGSVEQFEDLLMRMKKKYGHLYERG